MKQLKITLNFLVLFIIAASLNAQTVVTKQMQDRMNDKLPKEKLDKQTHRCIYLYTQQATVKENRETIYLTDTMALDLGKSLSLYYDWNKASRDSMNYIKTEQLSSSVKQINVNMKDDLASYKDAQGSYETTDIKGVSSKIYKNRLKNEIVTIDGNEMTMYKCKESQSPQNWTFTSDTLTVLGYICQKATTRFRGRNYEAWFTSDIPIKEGPWKLYGLPGLILKVIIDDGCFNIEAIGLENSKEKSFITMNKDSYINCTRKQLIEYMRTQKEHQGVRFNSGGVVTVGKTSHPISYNYLELE